MQDERRERLQKLTENLHQVGGSSGRRFISVSEFARRTTALVVVLIYGLILAGSAFIFYSQGQSGDWSSAGENALELVKIGLMPVITLVMGYYFGRNDQ